MASDLNVTDEFNTSNYRAHGEMRVRYENGLYQCELTGPFNEQFVMAYVQMWRSIIARIPNVRVDQHTVALTTWTHTMMASLPTMSLVASLMDKRIENVEGQIFPTKHYIWCIPKEIEGRQFMLSHWMAPYIKHKLHLTVVDNYDEALKIANDLVSKFRNDGSLAEDII